MNLCPDCKRNHDQNHYISDYGKTNYICDTHFYQKLAFFCEKCSKNLCSKCKTEHDKTHNIIGFNSGIYDDNDKEFTRIFNIFKNEINGIKNMVDSIVKHFELYSELMNKIKQNFKKENLNYQIFQNRLNIKKIRRR